MSEQSPQTEAEEPREEDAAEAVDTSPIMVLASDPPGKTAARIEEIPAPDGATVLEHMPVEQASAVTEYLDPTTAGKILSEMDPEVAAAILSGMQSAEGSMVLSAMDPDDRVDVLEFLSPTKHDEIVQEMNAEDKEETRKLEQYPPDSAGGIMTPEVTALYEYFSIQDAIDELRRMSQELEQMFYVYVIDRRGHLVGVLSMRDLILARPDKLLRDIMRPSVRSVPATMDQENVARLMRRYGFLAVPVVDEKNILVGLITVDDVVDVVEEEATEDVQKMFGAGAEERLTSAWHFSFRKRVWWLLVNLLTAFVAGAVVGIFEGTIQQFAILAVYMPIVAGMGGNASAQAMAVAVRGIALGEVDRTLLGKVLWRQTLVGFATGITVGIVTAAVALSFHGSEHGAMLGFVVGMALVINHTLAAVTGVGVPFAMKWLGFDPAQSATIFATTITDIVGFFSLLGLAKLCMS